MMFSGSALLDMKSDLFFPFPLNHARAKKYGEALNGRGRGRRRAPIPCNPLHPYFGDELRLPTQSALEDWFT